MKATNKVGRKLISLSIVTAIMVLMTPATAFAAESGGFAVVLPKMGEFIPSLIAFVLLWFVLAKVGWPIIVGMLDKRQETIKEDMAKAEEARIESERLVEEHKAELDSAKKEASVIIAEAKQSAEKLRTEITDQAREEAAAMISKAQVAIEAEKAKTVSELQTSVVDVSISVAGRLIGENLSDDEHRRLIERYVLEAGGLDAN